MNPFNGVFQERNRRSDMEARNISQDVLEVPFMETIVFDRGLFLLFHIGEENQGRFSVEREGESNSSPQQILIFVKGKVSSTIMPIKAHHA